MRIGITGATGFIGSHIVKLAHDRGDEVIGFTRNPSNPIPHCVETRPFHPGMPPDITGCDAIIHLAGESVFGLWTRAKRHRVRESRVSGTRSLVEAIAASSDPPRVLICSSGTAFYADTGDKQAGEDFPCGTDFLAEVTRAWETEALRAREKKVRVVLLRTSLVLGGDGGAMRMLKLLFRAGLGGNLGSGTQWVPWIHVADQAALALFAIDNDSIEGPLNAAAPEPCRNAEFTHALARALHRPAFFHVPAFALKIALGEFAGELIGSKRVVPKRALAAGFQFRFPSLSPAIADVVSPTGGARRVGS